jgi:hypothetical protein
MTPTPRTILALLGATLAGGTLTLVTAIVGGAPLGLALVELGLRLQGMGTTPRYVISVAPGLEDDTRVRALVQHMAVEEVTAHVTALLGPESVRTKGGE